MITVNIDVTKIRKDKLFKGEKGTYLDLVLFENKKKEKADDPDYFVKQKGSKEEDLPLIGRAKSWQKKDAEVQDNNEDLPF